MNQTLRILPVAISAALLWTVAVRAQEPVTVTVASQTRGKEIPVDFVGMSFGTRAILPAPGGGHFFSATNKPLVQLFQNIGIRHLRIGGTTVESPPKTPIPDEAAIDELFGFVEAAGVKKVIYSFRLLETNSALNYSATNAVLAKYIWDKHRDRLDCFAIGNEPDLKRVFSQDVEISNLATYLMKWRRFAAAIIAEVPEAKFAGPDGGSGSIDWTTTFAAKEKTAGNLALVTEHYYPGGPGRGKTVGEGVESVLSPVMDTNNETLYQKMAVPILAKGLPYRFTEANDHYSGGIPDASDSFAAALWALDFLHWWAAHEASGVNFHNTEWVVNDVITLDINHQPAPYPKAYGLKAFELGGHGSVETAAISNAAGINLTAYAVHDGTNDFVTVINKEYGNAARTANVTIALPGKAKRAEVIFLSPPNGDVTAKTGVTLGGASIGSQEPWHGEWTPATVDNSGQCTIKLPASSAAVVKISTS